jgi:sodium/bile acid cotransporter 7
MQATGQSGPIGPLLFQITCLTLLPFAIGVGLRRFIQTWIDANKRWVNLISNSVILFIVYTVFCDSVNDRIWDKYGLGLTVGVLLSVVLLFGTMSLLIYLTCLAAKLNREDWIAVCFCSVKKTLAMGVPLAMLSLKCYPCPDHTTQATNYLSPITFHPSPFTSHFPPHA